MYNEMIYFTIIGENKNLLHAYSSHMVTFTLSCTVVKYRI